MTPARDPNQYNVGCPEGYHPASQSLPQQIDLESSVLCSYFVDIWWTCSSQDVFLRATYGKLPANLRHAWNLQLKLEASQSREQTENFVFCWFPMLSHGKLLFLVVSDVCWQLLRLKNIHLQ